MSLNPSYDKKNSQPDSANTGPLRILCLIIFKWDNEKPIKLAATYDVSNFPLFHRSTVKESLLLGSRWIASQTSPGTRQAVQDDIGICYCYVKHSGLCANVITSPNYPQRVAFGLLNEALSEFTKAYDGVWQSKSTDVPEGVMFVEPGSRLMELYKNPSQADNIYKLQNELDEVKDVMLKSIDELLKRGEKLDTMHQKTLDLTVQARDMFHKARQANQCCKWY